MLVLTRKRGEAITIGPDIRVIVLQTKGGQVRLGVEAPRAVEVHRDEIYSRIRDENHLAASANVTAHDSLTSVRLRTVVGGKGQGSGKKLVRIA